MKKAALIFLYLVTYAISAQDLKYSIARNDNDYVTYKDVNSSLEKTPPNVIKKFNEIITSFKSSTCYIYKVSINDSLSSYALVINSFQQKCCYIIVYNNKDATVTNKPVKVNLKWAFNGESGFDQKLLSFPLISFKEYDGVYHCAIKERVHNGNIYNAVLNKQYILDKNLEFDLNFCFEEFAVTGKKETIKRILNKNEILVYIETLSSIDYVGKIILDIKLKKILKKECILEHYCESLFTISGEAEESLFKNGYQLSY